MFRAIYNPFVANVSSQVKVEIVSRVNYERHIRFSDKFKFFIIYKFTIDAGYNVSTVILISGWSPSRKNGVGDRALSLNCASSYVTKLLFANAQIYK